MLGSEKSVLPNANKTPVIVGIYGIPGSGKTFLLRQLEKELGREQFEFYEGSQVIASLVPGGLDRFREMREQDKVDWRQRAIETIRQECLDRGKVGVVTGHLMFWPEEKDAGQPVYTLSDLNTYTHIIYLDVAAELIAQRRQDDTERTRPLTSVLHLRKWQDTEKRELRQICRNYGMLFGVLSLQRTLVHKASAFLRDFRQHTEAHNLLCVERRLDDILGGDKSLQTMLVLDADRTLAPEDTGELFSATDPSNQSYSRSLKPLFGGPMGYSYTAFCQAAFLYEETAEESDFDALCTIVASAVHMHPEFSALLRLVAEQDYVGAVVVTCGLRAVWEKVLEREGLSKTVKVIGSGRIADSLVVTDKVKASIVSRLRDIHHLHVVAFGDSPLDLPMLVAADRAIVVVGEENTRSKTMDAALHKAMEGDGFRPSQVLLPGHASPRLNVADLPIVSLGDPEFINSIISCRRQPPTASPPKLHVAGKNVAKLLMTPTRDANINGPNLRAAHSRIGFYLATEFVTELVGLEEYAIPHVQGHQTSGFRLRDEKLTSIVALMRGGEPMAFGVSDALPEAMFVHAKNPADVLAQHLDGRHTVILVDSVVNSGKSVVQFVRHIRAIRPEIRIVVIAGVVQAQSVTDGGLAHTLAHDGNLHLVALRLSDNKFTGQGTTDTGNRLFNSTCLS